MLFKRSVVKFEDSLGTAVWPALKKFLLCEVRVKGLIEVKIKVKRNKLLSTPNKTVYFIIFSL